jgi:hypothetical protein
MNTFDDVIDMFLNLLSEAKYIEYSLDELKLELGIKVRMVLARTRVIKKVQFDKETQEFTRELNDTEALILAHGMMIYWLSPKIYNYEFLETQLASKDTTTFSNSGLLAEMRALKNDSEIEYNNLVTDYDYALTYPEEDEE